ncbi:MAG: hypothetical protein JO345_17490 [Streptosporangiaceae bacterium]|nr:hypothetical protein [Streptosporangiaceae bacterium]
MSVSRPYSSASRWYCPPLVSAALACLEALSCRTMILVEHTIATASERNRTPYTHGTMTAPPHQDFRVVVPRQSVRSTSATG